MPSLIIHVETKEKYDESKVYPKQRIEVPVRYVEDNIKIIYGCGIRMVTRAVTTLGTVEVERYGRRRVEYGTASCNGWTVVVVRDGSNSWTAVDRKEKER